MQIGGRIKRNDRYKMAYFRFVSSFRGEQTSSKNRNKNAKRNEMKRFYLFFHLILNSIQQMIRKEMPTNKWAEKHSA